MGDRISTSCFNNNTACDVGDDDDDDNTRHLNNNLKQRIPKCGPWTASGPSSFIHVICGTTRIIKKI
jgi:hypothetical protein